MAALGQYQPSNRSPGDGQKRPVVTAESGFIAIGDLFELHPMTIVILEMKLSVFKEGIKSHSVASSFALIQDSPRQIKCPRCFSDREAEARLLVKPKRNIIRLSRAY